MFVTIGTEIIETQGMREATARGINPAPNSFADREDNCCNSKRRRFESHPARYAAKPAFLRVLGVGGCEDLELGEGEVIDDERGKAEMLVQGRSRELFEQQPINQAVPSLARYPDNAIAVIILQR